MSDAIHIPAAVADVDTARVGRPALRHALFDVFQEQSWFIAVVLVYLAAGFAVGIAYGQDIRLALYNDIHLILYANFALFWVVFGMAPALAAHRPAHPIQFAWNELRTGYLTQRRLLNALPAFVLLPLALSMATSLKRLIPLISPFGWDPLLVEVDRVLHGGYHPWELLQPVLGFPLVTSFISNAYSLPWYVLILFVQFWQTFTLERQRTRFLLSYVLCWALIGNGLATALSSAGPCYYGYLFGEPDPFAPLMSYLASVTESLPVPSYMAQQYLWETYEKNFLSVGSGISAMPSLHISMGLLLVFLTWRRHWGLRLAAVVFLVILQIGSVHLGWHYAIDGYAAMIATALIWWAVGRALDWRERGRASLA